MNYVTCSGKKLCSADKACKCTWNGYCMNPIYSLHEPYIEDNACYDDQVFTLGSCLLTPLTKLTLPSIAVVRGAFKFIYWPKLGIWTNRLDPTAPYCKFVKNLSVLVNLKNTWDLELTIPNFGQKTNLKAPLMIVNFHHCCQTCEETHKMCFGEKCSCMGIKNNT